MRLIAIAALLIGEDWVRGAHCENGDSVTVTAIDPDRFFDLFNRIVLEENIDVAVVTVADEDVQSIYRYLSGREHH